MFAVAAAKIAESLDLVHIKAGQQIGAFRRPYCKVVKVTVVQGELKARGAIGSAGIVAVVGGLRDIKIADIQLGIALTGANIGWNLRQRNVPETAQTCHQLVIPAKY